MPDRGARARALALRIGRPPHPAGGGGARAGARSVSDEDRLYTRALPGGGYVAIESGAVDGDRTRVRAQVLVERRSDPTRRVGHPPPVVAVAEASGIDELIDELYRIAANNVEVARALQRWAARQRAGGGPAEETEGERG